MVDRTLITLFNKSVIESILSFCITCWGGNSSKGDRIKVDRIIKISEKFTTHAPHLDELYNKNTVDKIISISKDVRHPLYRFLINLSLTVLMGTVIYYDQKKKKNPTKTERHFRSFLPYTIRFLNDKNYNFSSL